MAVFYVTLFIGGRYFLNNIMLETSTKVVIDEYKIDELNNLKFKSVQGDARRGIVAILLRLSWLYQAKGDKQTEAIEKRVPLWYPLSVATKNAVAVRWRDVSTRI